MPGLAAPSEFNGKTCGAQLYTGTILLIGVRHPCKDALITCQYPH